MRDGAIGERWCRRRGRATLRYAYMHFTLALRVHHEKLRDGALASAAVGALLDALAKASHVVYDRLVVVG